VGVSTIPQSEFRQLISLKRARGAKRDHTAQRVAQAWLRFPADDCRGDLKRDITVVCKERWGELQASSHRAACGAGVLAAPHRLLPRRSARDITCVQECEGEHKCLPARHISHATYHTEAIVTARAAARARPVTSRLAALISVLKRSSTCF